MSPATMGRFLILLVSLIALPALLSRGKAHANDAVKLGAAAEETAAERTLRLRVNAAITRGAEWLAKQQHKDGAFRRNAVSQAMHVPTRHDFGETALAALTLAHCGYGPKTKVMKKALAYLGKNYRSAMNGDHHARASAYALSIYVLALHELYAVVPASDDGGKRNSRYAKAKVRRRNPCEYPSFVRRVLKDVVSWLVKKQARTGLFRYPSGTPEMPGSRLGGPGGIPAGPDQPPEGVDFSGPEDMSNTQYVLLAFWVTSICGKPVDAKTLKRVALRLLAVQEEDGPSVPRHLDPIDRKGRYAANSSKSSMKDRARGFGYTLKSGTTGAMTTAGLSSLLIVKSILHEMGELDDELRKKLDQAIWDAIAWTQVHYDVKTNPRQGRAWHYYYLYGLERAFVIARKRYIGEHDWYRDGAELLVEAQEESGRWYPPNPGHGAPGVTIDTSLWDTCFALLFLKRAAVHPRTPPLDRGPVTTPRASK